MNTTAEQKRLSTEYVNYPVTSGTDDTIGELLPTCLDFLAQHVEDLEIEVRLATLRTSYEMWSRVLEYHTGNFEPENDVQKARMEAAVRFHEKLIENVGTCQVCSRTRNRLFELYHYSVFNLMENVAPEGCYYGSHPTDCDDMGFWQITE